ncbi:PQQ-dependent sugar dehydrogenase [Candidatus Pacearchaeota archaeon]|nr:PQQ-dependent sugar dehydrogenase [Candidatus Pacearchaeota archaeon]
MKGKKYIGNLKIFLIVLIFLSAYFFLSNRGEPEKIEQGNYEFEVIADNLDTPWAIDFLPDERMIFTERPGRISIFSSDRGLKIVGNVEVNEVSESGLMGIAVDPDFGSNSYIYVYYTADKGNRVSRFVFDKDELRDEEILLDNIPNAMFHDGGRIKFGPDGKLYVATGDATNPSSAQDTGSLAGKILRINKDRGVPEDNPFENYVYSFGHRNPQGIAWHPKTKELYSSEHGPTRNDEINIIKKGGNYGWPKECTEEGDFINPIRCYAEFTLAPSGIAFYKGDLYVAGLRGTQLRRIVFYENNILKEEELFGGLGRIREVVAHGDYLYIATSNRDGRGNPTKGDDKIIRLKKKQEQ